MTDKTGEIQFVESNGTRTAFQRVGQGPLLVLIHGAEADRSMFASLVKALANSFTVVTYDQRDSGQTENGDTPYTLNDLADDAAYLIQSLAPSRKAARAHVYGTSLGGQIAQVLAARHPGLIDKLILGNTWRVGRPIPDFNPDIVRELGPLRADPRSNAAAIAKFFFTGQYLVEHPQIVEMFRGSKRSEAQQKRRVAMQASPCSMEYSSVTAPTLLMGSAADRLIPATATLELSNHIGNTECVVISNLPHAGVIESPARIAQEVRNFLQKG